MTMDFLFSNYNGAIKHVEKVPSLETLISIMNALEILFNIILQDIFLTDYAVKNFLLSERINKFSKENRENIYAVIGHKNTPPFFKIKRRCVFNGFSTDFQAQS